MNLVTGTAGTLLFLNFEAVTGSAFADSMTGGGVADISQLAKNASKAAQAAKMRAYWKARKAAEAKGSKAKRSKKEAPATAAVEGAKE